MFIRRVGQILSSPKVFRSNPLFPSRNTMTVSVTIADVSVLLRELFAYSARQLSVTQAHLIDTRRTRPSWISLSFLPQLCSFYCRVDIAKLTVNLWISLGASFSRRDLDGNGFKRFATLSMDIFDSIISKLGPIVLHWTLSRSGWEFAETSAIWRSRSADA